MIAMIHHNEIVQQNNSKARSQRFFAKKFHLIARSLCLFQFFQIGHAKPPSSILGSRCGNRFLQESVQYRNKVTSKISSVSICNSLRGGSTQKFVTDDGTRVHKKKSQNGKGKKRISKKKSEGTQQKLHRKAGNKNKNDELRDFENVDIQNESNNLPTVKAILLPRQISIPHIFRSLAALGFLTSFCWAIHTSGHPYRNAIHATLRQTWDGYQPSTEINFLDELIVTKILPSVSLPRKNMPGFGSIMGMIFSILILHLGFTVLLPSWSIPYRVWINFQKLDLSRESWKKIAWHLQPKENRYEDRFYESAYSNRIGARDEDSSCTRLAIWIQEPKELSKEKKLSGDEILPWVHYCQSFSNLNSKDIHPHPYYFEWNQRRIYLNFVGDTKSQDMHISIQNGAPDFFAKCNLKELRKNHAIGLADENKNTIKALKERYEPYSNMTLPTPELKTVLISRIMTPLAVVQFVGKFLNMLEENLLTSAFNMCMTLAQYYHDALKNIKHARTLSQEVVQQEEKYQSVWVLRRVGKKRKKKWISLPSHKLLPGDVFGLVSIKSDDLILPVDALLLDGSCVANEAALTGETVPQAKVPLQDETDMKLDMIGKHRDSILFAGTNILYCRDDEGDDNNEIYPPMPQKNMAKCLALRTGSYSSRGEIVRALCSSKGGDLSTVSTPESDRDALILIASLTLCAVLACSSLFVPTLQRSNGKKSSYYRRIIQCSRIAVASIPSDLPLALSAIAHSSSTNLRKDCDVVCADPGSLMVSSQVDMVVFDKTGTLTADTQALKMIVGQPLKENSKKKRHQRKKKKKRKKVGENSKCESHHFMTNVVLAGCHSLISIDDESSCTNERNNNDENTLTRLVGDPLDLVSLKYSGWAFDGHNKLAKNTASQKLKVKSKLNKNFLKTPKQLWQIKSFPFDPNIRLSSALLLVLGSDNEFKIWRVVKGSPESMKDLLVPKHEIEKKMSKNEAAKFKKLRKWYEEESYLLGSQGTRLIAMGAEDVTNKENYAKILFPEGLSKLNNIFKSNSSVRKKNSLDSSILDFVKTARKVAKKLVNRDGLENAFQIEDIDSKSTSTSFLEFIGFACFDASIRSSSTRVVSELRRADINVCMLTGDGTEAAMKVAEDANIMGYVDAKDEIKPCSSVAILDLDSHGTHKIKPRLQWTFINKKSSKDGMKESFSHESFSYETIFEVIHKKEQNKCSIVATGRSVDFAISKLYTSTNQCNLQKSYKFLLKNLHKVSVISRASPEVKKRVITYLKDSCHRKVMMCGDGVNDIAAMETADVSIALLTGYGSESEVEVMGKDLQDERRKETIKRKHSLQPTELKNIDDAALIGVGSTPIAVQARIKKDIDETLAKSRNEQVPTFGTIARAVINAMKKERKRSQLLLNGGGEAARILVEEEKLKRSLMVKSNDSNIQDSRKKQLQESSDAHSSAIKPGEACLAAAFTFLRPCIDGTDSILRMGIATAASSISTYQTIALNCLMSCYNLATLYRDGFRYGKYMWNVELAFIMGIDRAKHAATSTPRPRISSVRPHRSIFHPSSAISVLLQALIHLCCLQIGVEIAGGFKDDSIAQEQSKMTVNWKRRDPIIESPNALERLGSALVASSFQEESTSKGLVRTLFGRPPFSPNHITNIVFLLSIFQNTMVALINHRGEPFYGSFLESKQFCQFVMLSLFFCVAATSEAFPMMNEFLELAPIPTKRDKIKLLTLFFINFTGCFVTDRLCKLAFEKNIHVSPKKSSSVEYAADLEEEMLSKQRQHNKKFMIIVTTGMVFVVAKSLCK